MAEPRVLRRPGPRAPGPDHLEACPSCGHLVRVGDRCEACEPAWPSNAEDSVWLPVLLALFLMVAVVVAFVWL
jgi:uncharacterized protein (DUF983 family)